MLDLESLDTNVLGRSGSLDQWRITFTQGHHIAVVLFVKRQQFSVSPNSADIERVTGRSSAMKDLL
jgi:hypothetical protein